MRKLELTSRASVGDLTQCLLTQVCIGGRVIGKKEEATGRGVSIDREWGILLKVLRRWSR